jgi:parvulin-like peptidyl-prolyl isomerase
VLARLCGVAEQTSFVALQLRAASATEPVAEVEIERELNLLRAQFGDDELFRQALASSHLSLGAIREEITEDLRARSWIEKQIASQLGSTQAEARQFYDADAAQFQQPQRYRASHLFLAAPAGSARELIAGKQSAIQGLAVRMLAGESLEKVAAEASEDEATKSRGGDLGYFAATRMPPEFFAEAEKLQTGSISAPFQSHLGFHIMRLSEAKPPGKLTFAEAQPEIVVALENAKRAAAVSRLRDRLSAR